MKKKKRKRRNHRRNGNAWKRLQSIFNQALLQEAQNSDPAGFIEDSPVFLADGELVTFFDGEPVFVDPRLVTFVQSGTSQGGSGR